MSILGGCILPREEFVNKSAKSETLVILWLAQRSRCEAGEDKRKNGAWAANKKVSLQLGSINISTICSGCSS
jgi:hypothetical protein